MNKLMNGYIWKRTGRCDPKQCGAFCCRTGAIMTCINKDENFKDHKKYYELQNMQEIGEIDGSIIMSNRVACAALRGLRCSIHKKRPITCKQFPLSPTQDFYKIAKQHGCTYSFKQVKITKKKIEKSTRRTKHETRKRS